MKVGFIRALIGSCCGIAVFEQLRHQHGFRTFFHLVLMALLCSAIMGIGIHQEWKKKSDSSIRTIADHCGVIKINSNGFIPEKSPDQLINFVIAGPFVLTYLPENSVLPEDFHQGCNNGMIWSGNKVLLWQKASGKFLLTPISNSQSVDEEYAVSAAEIEQILFDLPGVKIHSEFNLNTSSMNVLSNIVLFMVQVLLACVNFMQVVFYIAIFAGIFALMNMGRTSRFSTREMIKLAVYAGFPPMLIGSVASLMELPLLNFNLTYVLGMTFYLMYIMNHLDRVRQEREWQKDEQQ